MIRQRGVIVQAALAHNVDEGVLAEVEIERAAGQQRHDGRVAAGEVCGSGELLAEVALEGWDGVADYHEGALHVRGASAVGGGEGEGAASCVCVAGCAGEGSRGAVER